MSSPAWRDVYKRQVINEETTVEELGGAQVHARKSGVSHFTYDTEGECLMGVRKLLNYLPSNFEEKAPVIRPEEKRALAKNVNKVLEHVGPVSYTHLDVYKRQGTGCG